MGQRAVRRLSRNYRTYWFQPYFYEGTINVIAGALPMHHVTLSKSPLITVLSDITVDLIIFAGFYFHEFRE